MEKLVATAGLAIVTGVLITSMALPVGRRFGFVVRPRLFGRSDRSISYLGGVALALAAVGAFLLTSAPNSKIWLVIVGGVAVLMLGLLDDRLGSDTEMYPLVRMAIEGVIAFFVWMGGVRAFASGPVWLDAVITVFFLVGAVNAFNLVDNMDGVAGMTVVGTGLGISAVAFLSSELALAAFCISLTGAAAAFLTFNLTNARVYLGDSGSLFLGFVLGGAALLLEPGLVPAGNSLAAVVLLAIPLTDTASRQLSRWAAGGSIFDVRGGTDHISHLLVEYGLTSRQAAMAHGGAALFASSAAVLATITSSISPLIGALALFTVGGLMFAGRLRERSRLALEPARSLFFWTRPERALAASGVNAE